MVILKLTITKLISICFNYFLSFFLETTTKRSGKKKTKTITVIRKKKFQAPPPSALESLLGGGKLLNLHPKPNKIAKLDLDLAPDLSAPDLGISKPGLSLLGL
jgi:hypothetical protein